MNTFSSGSSSGGFNFSNPNPLNAGATAPSNALSASTFGNPSSSAPSTSASSGFNFGNPNNTPNTAAPSTNPSFSFGNPSNTSNDAKAPSNPGFSFANPSNPSNTATAPSNPSSGFSFSNPINPSNTATAPSNPSSGFSFSNPSNPTNAATAPSNPSSGFSFANPSNTSKDTTVQSGFSFGGSSESKSAAPAETKPHSFSFNSGTNAAGSTSTATDSTSKAPSFNFGGVNTSTEFKQASGAVPAESKAETKATTGASTTTAGFNFNAGSQKPESNNDSNTGANPSFTAASAERKEPSATPAQFSFSTPALAPTPAAAKESFSTTAPTATSAAAPGTAATNTYPVQPSPPIEYQTRTISEIINILTGSLEEDANLFLSEAKRIAEYDVLLRDSQQSISDLNNSVQTLLYHQSELDRNLCSVGSFHSEMDTMLSTLEKQVDELYSVSSQHVTPLQADEEREKIYYCAINLNSKLQELQGRMESEVTKFNNEQEKNQKLNVSDNVMEQMVQVLNCHYENLAWLERTNSSLQNDAETVGKALRDID